MRKLFRMVVKWAPIIYPIARKFLAKRRSKAIYRKR